MTDRQIRRDQVSAITSSLWEGIKNHTVVPGTDRYPKDKEVWFLDYGEIPTKTTIRDIGIGVHYPPDCDAIDGPDPYPDWTYKVKGKQSEYFESQLFLTRRDAELELARHRLKTFTSQFFGSVQKNGFTIDDFPELTKMVEGMKEMRYLG